MPFNFERTRRYVDSVVNVTSTGPVPDYPIVPWDKLEFWAVQRRSGAAADLSSLPALKG